MITIIVKVWASGSLLFAGFFLVAFGTWMCSKALEIWGL